MILAQSLDFCARSPYVRAHVQDEDGFLEEKQTWQFFFFSQQQWSKAVDVFPGTRLNPVASANFSCSSLLSAQSTRPPLRRCSSRKPSETFPSPDFFPTCTSPVIYEFPSLYGDMEKRPRAPESCSRHRPWKSRSQQMLQTKIFTTGCSQTSLKQRLRRRHSSLFTVALVKDWSVIFIVEMT